MYVSIVSGLKIKPILQCALCFLLLAFSYFFAIFLHLVFLLLICFLSPEIKVNECQKKQETVAKNTIVKTVAKGRKKQEIKKKK